MGGLKSMGEVMDRGMVLVLSLWDDAQTQMDWLDSATTADGPITKPGVVRGPCSTAAGAPSAIRSAHGDATVKYTNLKYGEIGSTFSSTSAPAAPVASPSVSQSPQQSVMQPQPVPAVNPALSQSPPQNVI